MRVDWSRIPRRPAFFTLLFFAAPVVVFRDVELAVSAGAAAVLGFLAVAAAYGDLAWTPGGTVEQWRENERSREGREGCALVLWVLAGCAQAGLVGWNVAGLLDFSLLFVQILTALAIALSHLAVFFVCIGTLMETPLPVVPPDLRAELASRPRVVGRPGGDPREIAPGFVADLDPQAAPPVPSVTAPAAQLRRVFRIPQVAPWRPATTRRLRASEWRSVVGWRFFTGELAVIATLAVAVELRSNWGTAIAALALVFVTGAAWARALRWEWPGEVAIADWFRSERSLVNTQIRLAETARVVFIAGAIVTGGEALFRYGASRTDFVCGTPLLLGGLGTAMWFVWRQTLRRVIGEQPAVRSVPEPIRQAVLAVARRKEQVTNRNAETEEVSVVEELAGVPVAPDRAEEAAPSRFTVPEAEAGAMAREAPERILAELSRAATLRSDGPALVRRVERRLALTGPQPDDTDLLVEVADLLFVAFPDRADALITALGDALAGPKKE